MEDAETYFVSVVIHLWMGSSDGQALPAKINPYQNSGELIVKIAKTADRKKFMDTTKSTDCPKCGKPTRIVKRVKDRERGVPGGIFISCSACEFYEKL